jgi:predicted nucleotidyltransferase
MNNNNIQSLAKRYGIILIYLFGSQSDKGRRYLEGQDVEADIFVDLDIAVAFEKPPVDTMKTYGNIFKELSKIFDPFNIDLVFMHELSVLFQYEVIKGVRIYEKDEFSTDEFEEGIMKKAEDLFFKKRIFDEEVMEAIENGYFEFEYSPNS